MMRFIKRYFAIRSYVKRLGEELLRRFGRRRFYKIDQVTQAVRRGGFPAMFIAYAHAAFCCQEDFETHYQAMGVTCTYAGLRRTIGRRYFSGRTDFDAQTIADKHGRSDHGGYYESGIGVSGGGEAGH